MTKYRAFTPTLTNFRDKARCQDYYIRQMLARTQSMFKYSGLPESIPQRMLELFLQTNGNICIAEHNGDLYAFTGGFGGEPDPYYRPTLYTVANPALNLSRSYNIDKDCVIILCDSLALGLRPMFERYSSLLVENDVSILLADINLRVASVISAEDDRTAQAAKVYLEQVESGKLGVIAESTLIGGLKTQPFLTSGNSNIITQLIELEQYLKASWYNDLGIQSNYNMKREAIGADESALQYDSLLPLVDDMLNCRKEGIEKVNAMFGTNISVDLNSVWEDRQEKIELSIDEVEQAEEISGQPENEGEENGKQTE